MTLIADVLFAGCLTSVLQVFLGVQAGSALVTFPSWRSRVVRWFAWAVVLAVAGICGWYFGGIPINKSLWCVRVRFLTIQYCFFRICKGRSWELQERIC